MDIKTLETATGGLVLGNRLQQQLVFPEISPDTVAVPDLNALYTDSYLFSEANHRIRVIMRHMSLRCAGYSILEGSEAYGEATHLLPHIKSGYGRVHMEVFNRYFDHYLLRRKLSGRSVRWNEEKLALGTGESDGTYIERYIDTVMYCIQSLEFVSGISKYITATPFMRQFQYPFVRENMDERIANAAQLLQLLPLPDLFKLIARYHGKVRHQGDDILILTVPEMRATLKENVRVDIPVGLTAYEGDVFFGPSRIDGKIAVPTATPSNYNDITLDTYAHGDDSESIANTMRQSTRNGYTLAAVVEAVMNNVEALLDDLNGSRYNANITIQNFYKIRLAFLEDGFTPDTGTFGDVLRVDAFPHDFTTSWNSLAYNTTGWKSYAYPGEPHPAGYADFNGPDIWRYANSSMMGGMMGNLFIAGCLDSPFMLARDSDSPDENGTVIWDEGSVLLSAGVAQPWRFLNGSSGGGGITVSYATEQGGGDITKMSQTDALITSVNQLVRVGLTPLGKTLPLQKVAETIVGSVTHDNYALDPMRSLNSDVSWWQPKADIGKLYALLVSREMKVPLNFS